MRQTPAQGFEDFDSLAQYVAEWIQPCLLGDLRRLVAGLKQDLGPTDAQERPYGAGKFMALGTLLFSSEHLGSLLVEDRRGLFDHGERFRALFHALGGEYDLYKNILTEFGRHAIIHNFWPNTLLRYAFRRRMVRSDPSHVVVGLGVSDLTPEGFENFAVRLFRKNFPRTTGGAAQPLEAFEWHYEENVVAIRLFVNIEAYFRRIDDYFFREFQQRDDFGRLDTNFRLLQAASVREKNFPALPREERLIRESLTKWPRSLWNQPKDELETDLLSLLTRADALKGRVTSPRPEHRG